ncbi:glutathione S-transferase family protein [Vogesella oryzae]|uniref:glutathione S-transferase family protein n=1 Tax=Vogesella oryzae TaxID=1735285 RepID=UPI001583CA5A|nr:glutathione S-transferase family protein [Vogesella oryzae]
MLKLYQFRFSHFCEKARWALDYKTLPYQVVNLLPGFHVRVTSKLAPASSVPIVVAAGRVIQGSNAIIDWLDDTWAPQPLTPGDQVVATQAREWEHWLVEEVGVTLRQWFYHHALQERDKALAFLLPGTSWLQQLQFRLAFPVIRDRMRQFMHINAPNARQAERRLLQALDRLDAELATRAFLAGDGFSRADLSMAALLAPLWAQELTAEEMSQRLPEPVLRLRESLLARPVLRRVAALYRDYR